MRTTLKDAQDWIEDGQTVKAVRDCNMYDIGKAGRMAMRDYAFSTQLEGEKCISYIVYDNDNVVSYIP